MALETLAYVSEARRGLALRDLKAILRKSREKNFRAGISGYLVFDGVYFAQILEGEEGTLQPLFHTIEADPRHHDVRLLHARPVTRRGYGDWAMGCANLSAPVDVDTSELRGIIRDFMDHRTPSFGEVHEFFRLFVEFQTPEQAAMLTI